MPVATRHAPVRIRTLPKISIVPFQAWEVMGPSIPRIIDTKIKETIEYKPPYNASSHRFLLSVWTLPGLPADGMARQVKSSYQPFSFYSCSSSISLPLARRALTKPLFGLRERLRTKRRGVTIGKLFRPAPTRTSRVSGETAERSGRCGARRKIDGRSARNYSSYWSAMAGLREKDCWG